MRLGVFLPNFGELADPRVTTRLAVEAEAAGWDGVFLWDHVQYRPPVTDVGDPWIAMATERVMLGALVTPLDRRRPQVLARQCVTLDQLSNGRLVFGVGLGLDASGAELSSFGEELDAARRAAMLDESLELITDLWTGEPVDHHGEHYLAAGVRFLPRPEQRPRIPVWVAARYPNRAPVRRAARWDGMFPIDMTEPEQLHELLDVLRAERGEKGLDGYDVVVQGLTGEDPAPWAAAGATWWMARFDPFTITEALARATIDAIPL